MTPRVWMMREMLKPGGVIAICIDHRELFRLGMLMDEILLGGVCEVGRSQWCHGGPKRAQSWKRRIEPSRLLKKSEML
jgi:hypothetical protein